MGLSDLKNSRDGSVGCEAIVRDQRLCIKIVDFVYAKSEALLVGAVHLVKLYYLWTPCYWALDKFIKALNNEFVISIWHFHILEFKL